MAQNRRMKNNIDAYLSLVKRLSSDHSALEEAKNLVPIAQIVQDNLDVLEGDYQEKMLPHLTDWFANQFFSWFQAPACELCGQDLDSCGSSLNVEGKQVEHYICNNSSASGGQNGSCQFTYDFIRHNDPAILMTTRRGRCGEWANCFFVFLKALDYDARIVFDSTDHVWNEVWSEPKQRWIHVDSCENSIDNPLLYEAGWSKKLEYCLAFGPHEALDVTRRYAIDFEGKTRAKRNSCDEIWLEEYLSMLTGKLLLDAPANLKQSVLKRHLMDKQSLVQLAKSATNVLKAADLVANGNSGGLSGRKSGSMAWRIQRGEFCPILKNSHVVKITTTCDEPTKIAQTGPTNSLIGLDCHDEKFLFELKYNSIADCYTSSSIISVSGNSCSSKKWSSLIYLSENLDYKYERDWKTAYLARYETCPANVEGKIVWKFDISSLKSWKRIELKLDCKCYPMTTVEIELRLYDKDSNFLESKSLQVNHLSTIARDSIQSDSSLVHFLELVATLKGGDPSDSVAWQKPQLFRQTRNVDDNLSPFNFRVF